MAQTGYTPISIYYSATATNTPTAGNLVAGELAINTADGKLFYKDSAGVVQVIGTKGGVGSSTTTQVLYNSSGLVVGSANMTFNGTTFTLANDATISGLTVGKGGGADAEGTAVGYQALNVNSGTNGNAAFGYQTLLANTSGIYNVGVGKQALKTNTSGTYNNAVGVFSLYYNTTGGNNTAQGYQSLFNNTTASNNVGVGFQALLANTTASNNTAVGYQALYSNSTGTGLTAIGYGAGYASTANNGTYLGWYSGFLVTGAGNTLVGGASGYGSVNLTTGTYNTLVGYGASTNGAGDTASIVIGSTNSATGLVGKGSTTGFISPNGGGVYQGNNSTLWSITSDQRLKKNIVDNTDGLNKITAIQVRNFEYRTADEVTELEPQNAIDIKGVQLGAIAQELQTILPDCVKTESTGVMSVDASNLTWYLINAVKELNAKVTALEAQLGK